MTSKLKIGGIVAALLLPVMAFAQELENLDSLVGSIGSIVNRIIPILFAIALLAFFYGLVRYIFAKEQDKEQAKKTMIWGVVALFVMASVWGLVRFIGDAVGIDEGENNAPDVDTLIPNIE